MSFKGRISRLAFAVGVAGLISAQIPTSGGAAMADNYNLGGGSSARVPIEIAIVGLVGYGIFSTFAGGAASSAGSAGAAGAAGAGDAGAAGAAIAGDSPVWDVANNNPDLTTFASESDTADLKHTLRDAGNYTVFAPTNEAFAALAPGTLTSLGQPANVPQLQQLLKYHIIAGHRYTIAELKALPGVSADPGASLMTMTGSPLYIKYSAGAAATDAGGLAVSGTPFGPSNETGLPITQSDINARNGVIHPIGGVLPLPSPTTP